MQTTEGALRSSIWMIRVLGVEPLRRAAGGCFGDTLPSYAGCEGGDDLTNLRLSSGGRTTYRPIHSLRRPFSLSSPPRVSNPVPNPHSTRQDPSNPRYRGSDTGAWDVQRCLRAAAGRREVSTRFIFESPELETNGGKGGVSRCLRCLIVKLSNWIVKKGGLKIIRLFSIFRIYKP